MVLSEKFLIRGSLSTLKLPTTPRVTKQQILFIYQITEETDTHVNQADFHWSQSFSEPHFLNDQRFSSFYPLSSCCGSRPSKMISCSGLFTTDRFHPLWFSGFTQPVPFNHCKANHDNHRFSTVQLWKDQIKSIVSCGGWNKSLP